MKTRLTVVCGAVLCGIIVCCSAGNAAALEVVDGFSVMSLAFSPDGKVVAAGGGDNVANGGEVLFWDAQTGVLLRKLTGHTDFVTSITFSPDGKTLASGSKDETVILWDTQTGEPKRTLTGHWGRVSAVAFSPDGKILVSGSSDWTVRLWDVDSGALVQTLVEFPHGASAVTFSPDGTMLATTSPEQPESDTKGEPTKAQAERVFVLVEEALAAKRAGRLDEAEAKLRQALELDPHNVRAHWVLALRIGGAPPNNRGTLSPHEAEALQVVEMRNSSPRPQELASWGAEKWSGGAHLLGKCKYGSSLTLLLPVASAGRVRVDLYATQAPGYGQFQVSMDGQKIGEIFDGFAPAVRPSGRISLGTVSLDAGVHRLRFDVVGKNPASWDFWLGIDCIDLVPLPE